MTVVFVDVGDVDLSLIPVPEGATEAPKPEWGDNPVEVSAVCAANAIAEAVEALKRKTYPGMHFVPFFATPGLFPVPEEEEGKSDNATVPIYAADGTLQHPRICAAQI